MTTKNRGFTLFASDSDEARELKREIEDAGNDVQLVLCLADGRAPRIENAFVQVSGFENIRRLLVPHGRQSRP